MNIIVLLIALILGFIAGYLIAVETIKVEARDEIEDTHLLDIVERDQVEILRGLQGWGCMSSRSKVYHRGFLFATVRDAIRDYETMCQDPKNHST